MRPAACVRGAFSCVGYVSLRHGFYFGRGRRRDENEQDEVNFEEYLACFEEAHGVGCQL